MRVEIVPKSKRARERVKVHGTEMELLDDGPNAFRVRSLEMTASWQGVKEFWEGWFNKETEASFRLV